MNNLTQNYELKWCFTKYAILYKAKIDIKERYIKCF
jgi:hypothetical protein